MCMCVYTCVCAACFFVTCVCPCAVHVRSYGVCVLAACVKLCGRACKLIQACGARVCGAASVSVCPYVFVYGACGVFGGGHCLHCLKELEGMQL